MVAFSFQFEERPILYLQVRIMKGDKANGFLRTIDSEDFKRDNNIRGAVPYTDLNGDISNHKRNITFEQFKEFMREIGQTNYNMDILNNRWNLENNSLKGLQIICKSLAIHHRAEFTEEVMDKIENLINNPEGVKAFLGQYFKDKDIHVERTCDNPAPEKRYREINETQIVGNESFSEVISIQTNQSGWVVVHPSLHHATARESKFGDNVSISIQTDSEDETTKLFNKLSGGGDVKMPLSKTFWNAYFGMCVDKFGIHWKVNYDYNQ